jgi:MoxR-like ATPase
MDIILYTGQKLLKEEKKTKKKGEKKTPEPYIPSPELVKAVRFAQISKRPLLVKGEPGCGKSSLAEAIAYELFDGIADYNDYFFKWYVKSSSKAQEGLYHINHLDRLQQANTRENEGRKSTDIILKTNQQRGEYIELGALGKAFQVTNTMADDLPPPVVLIDEIDKADIDFPNDLLLELDKMEFTINEAKNELDENVTIKANKDKKPLIIITSNDEKPLPPAFLRRCLFFYINFPGPEILFDIVAARNMEGVNGN